MLAMCERDTPTRRTAKELLVEAHLGIAHDIAWGAWNRKSQVVPKWLQEGDALAQEALAAGDATEALSFRVGQQALSTLAGMKGDLDPTSWVASTGPRIVTPESSAPSTMLVARLYTPVST